MSAVEHLPQCEAVHESGARCRLPVGHAAYHSTAGMAAGLATIWPNPQGGVDRRAPVLYLAPTPRIPEPVPEPVKPTLDLWEKVDRRAREQETWRLRRWRKGQKRPREVLSAPLLKKIRMAPLGTWTPLWLVGVVVGPEDETDDEQISDEDLLPWERRERLLGEYAPAVMYRRRNQPRGGF